MFGWQLVSQPVPVDALMCHKLLVEAPLGCNAFQQVPPGACGFTRFLLGAGSGRKRRAPSNTQASLVARREFEFRVLISTS